MLTFNKKKSNQFKGFFVDLDGTLANSMEFLLYTYKLFLEPWGVNGTQEEFTLYIGVPLEDIVARLLKDYQRKEMFADEIKRYRDLLRDFSKSAKPFEGAKEALEFAKNKGKIVALVTSAEQGIAETFIQANQLNHLFDVIVGAKHGTKGKPDPELYVEALRCTDLKPDEVLAVEDSMQGILAATHAGIQVVHFLPNNGSITDGYFTVRNWNELAQLLEKLQ